MMHELQSYIMEYRERIDYLHSAYDAGVLHGLLIALRIWKGADHVRQ